MLVSAVVFKNEAYIDAGAQIVENPKEIYRADMIIKVKEPLPQEYELIKKRTTHIHLFSLCIFQNTDQIYDDL